MSKPEMISSPSSFKSSSSASARKRVLRPSSTTKSAWALASERFTPPPPIKISMTPSRFKSPRHSVASPSKGPFTCPNNGGKRRKTENFPVRKPVPKRKLSVQTEEEYLSGYRNLASHKTNKVVVDLFVDERDDTLGINPSPPSSPFRIMDKNKRETSEHEKANVGEYSRLFKKKDFDPNDKSGEIPLQKHIEDSLYRLENEVSQLSKEVKSKNDQIDKLAEDTKKHQRKLSIERNLRVQAELKEIGASHAAYAKASEEARNMAVEQVSKSRNIGNYILYSEPSSSINSITDWLIQTLFPKGLTCSFSCAQEQTFTLVQKKWRE